MAAEKEWGGSTRFEGQPTWLGTQTGEYKVEMQGQTESHSVTTGDGERAFPTPNQTSPRCASRRVSR